MPIQAGVDLVVEVVHLLQPLVRPNQDLSSVMFEDVPVDFDEVRVKRRLQIVGVVAAFGDESTGGPEYLSLGSWMQFGTGHDISKS